MRTKIIATVGPSSENPEILNAMAEAGMDICRLNFSHGKHSDFSRIINNILNVVPHAPRQLAILADLQGPKIRVGDVAGGGVELKSGDSFVLTSDRSAADGLRSFYISYPRFASDVQKGETILIDDGKMSAVVESIAGKNKVTLSVKHGGILKPNKGVNLPNTNVSLPSLTEKDLLDLEFILKKQISWVALSFVRSAADVKSLKKKVAAARKSNRLKVMAKIEKPEAMEDINNIIDEADGIMIARGDLGVEMPLEQLPLIQKDIIRKCLALSKPVVVATQMMESMITQASPTRAEVNDIANSVLDGADALMLSAETSVGAFPVVAVRTMQRIALHIENNSESLYNHLYETGDPNHPRYISDTVISSACHLAERSGAKAIIGMTHTGYTAFRLASHRPRCPVYIFTGNHSLLKILSLVWGVNAFYYDKYLSTDHTIADLKQRLLKMKLLKRGDLVVNIASIPVDDFGKTNMLKLSEV
jgi:pyruvate kinase